MSHYFKPLPGGLFYKRQRKQQTLKQEIINQEKAPQPFPSNPGRVPPGSRHSWTPARRPHRRSRRHGWPGPILASAGTPAKPPPPPLHSEGSKAQAPPAPEPQVELYWHQGSRSTINAFRARNPGTAELLVPCKKSGVV